MLNIIRKKKGAPLVKALLIGLALSFFGGFGLLGYCTRQQKAAEAERNRAATVNDSVISINEVNRLATNMRAQRGAQSQTELEWLQMREEALDTLIKQRLVLQEANKLGVSASDADVRARLMQTFQVDGVFRPDLYSAFLQRQGLGKHAFEEQLRNELKVNKMLRLVSGNAVVFDEDILQAYRYENEQADLELIMVGPESITDVAEPSTGEIKLKFDESIDGYTVSEKRLVKYVCFDNEEMAANTEIPEDKLKKFYETVKDRKFARRPRKVKVSVIQFKVDPSATGDEQKELHEKADRVLSDARLGVSSFENLAAIYSDDEASKGKGGDLGWMDLGEDMGGLNPVLAEMEPGDISDIINDMEGMRIYKVVEEKPGRYKPYRKVKKEAIKLYIENGRGPKAKKAAQDMLDAIQDETPFEKAAKNATAEIHISELFDDTGKNLPPELSPEAFAQAAFGLWDIGQVADVVETEGGACLLQLTKIEDAHDASFEEAAPLIREELQQEARKEKARQLAEDFLKKIQGGAPFEEIAAMNYAKLVKTDYFARAKGQIPNVGYSKDLLDTAFALPPHDPIAQKVFEVSGKFYIVKLMGRKDADPNGLDKQKPLLKLRIDRQRQNELADSWIEALKEQAAIDRKNLGAPADRNENTM